MFGNDKELGLRPFIFACLLFLHVILLETNKTVQLFFFFCSLY